MNARKRRELPVYFAFIGPALIVYLTVVAYPVLYSLFLSFSDFNPNIGGTWNFVGFTHYHRMIQDPNFWHALKNNMIVVAVSVFGQIPIGFVLAYILYRRMVKARIFFQSMIFLPHFLSVIVIGTIWKRMFEADGPVSGIIQLVSGDQTAQFEMMLHQNQIMIPIGFALIWIYTGLYMIIFLANLQKIEESLIESAKIDGAREAQIFMKIIVPILWGTILISSVLAIAGSLKGFDLIFGITTQGLQRQNALVLPIFMYETAFRDYSDPMRFAYGATISNAIVAISLFMIVISNLISRKFRPNEED
ncbi:MAG: sugar ABC transporter permease [Spirochaetia bacterium]|nr:sugar ABC transporter permease [Spirochaetia bacterium]MCF7946749.1 sugar ABC transporter permease [Spirochaetia bacterium]MCF7952461.1 sugar ABC transporter permease [Spirochaetales bacterium]